jgi:hypothetical protein
MATKFLSLILNPNQVFTRVDDHHEKGESNDEEPEVDEEVVSAPLDDLNDGCDQRKSYDLHQDELLDLKCTNHSKRLCFGSVI